MRVAVIGATGNTGTAVLRALKDTPEVTEIIGVARRLPDPETEPYTDCRWESVDIGASTDTPERGEEVIGELTELFDGCDAVIHLAWLIQPNDRRELLRRVNVTGTERVAEAVARADVPHLVVASSLGAYEPDPARQEHSDTPPPARDETWPVTGIPGSHYSEDKADQERALDAFTERHPEVTVTRLRPALIFQGLAASEIQRYFLGEWLPLQALKAGDLPGLPVPSNLFVQAVHADDVGRAYAAAVVHRLPGAFNIAADDILGPQELADIVDHGRVIPAPAAVVRAALAAAYKTGAVPADPGWIDMAMNVPMLDSTRAREELGWRPTHSAADALAELLDGLAHGSGHNSPPLQPRDLNDADVPEVSEPAARGASAGESTDPGISEDLSADILGLYVSDHLTGATAGANRIERMANDFVDTPVYPLLAQVALEIKAERTFLRNLVHDLDIKQRRYRQVTAWAGERVGRLKFNGRVMERSPMTMLLETELMRGAITAKRGGWLTLRANAENLGLDPDVFTDLVTAADKQLESLERVHEYARVRAFDEDRRIYREES